MHYRVPLFEKMSKSQDLELLVIHGDEQIKDVSFPFATRYLPVKKIGGFVFQPGLQAALENGDTILCMFDIRWISIVLCTLKPEIANKCYLWTHGYGRVAILNRIRVLLAEKCKGLVLYYKEFGERYEEYGFPKDKIYESSNTLAVENHSFAPEIKRGSFLYVGRLQKRKRIDELILAFGDVSKYHPELSLDIIGEGAIRAELQQMVVRMGISSRVKFHGKCIDEGRLRHFFQRALAYISPGHVGLGVLHAFAYGCPVITDARAYHAPEFVNVKDGENSILFGERGTTLTSAMRRLAESPSLSVAMGDNAYNLYRSERTIEIMVENLINLK